MDDVGRYRIARRIGEGGMAEVFEGVALGAGGFQRRVAIKRLLLERSYDAAFGRMFLDEARIASQLHHANIVGVLDYGLSEGLPFQVLEFVDGLHAGRLRERGEAAGAPLPVEVTLYVCTEIAHALAYAHAARDADGQPLGIVHRDVSPGNILISWSGDVKLSDFGIAFAKGRLETTTAGMTKGTLLYMAPEQIMRGELDARTDVFALGCVLHALLAGQSPLAGEGVMAELVAGKPLRIDPSLPDDVYDLVVKATRLHRADRFASAAAMAEALGAALTRRIARDAKSIASEWLAKVRGEAGERRGRLDAFLGVEMILAPTHQEAREFDMRKVEAEEPIEPPRRRWWAWVTAAAATGAATGALLIARGERAALAVADAAPSVSMTPVAVHAPVIVPDAAAPVIVVPDAAAVETATAPPRPPRPRPRPPTPATDTVTEGVLVVGGEGAIKGEIVVDGRSLGFAPRVLHLPVGVHQVELVLPDGNRLHKRVEVRPTHTPTAPLRWTVAP